MSDMTSTAMTASSDAMQHLENAATHFKATHLSTLFAKDPARFAAHSHQLDALFVDFSKQRLDASVIEALVALANERGLPEWITRLFSDERINESESRAAMHWALRVPEMPAMPEAGVEKGAENSAINSAGNTHNALGDINAGVHQALGKMYQLVEKIHAGQYRGVTGEVVTDVVNIGVGGSDLGPLMASIALSDFEVKTEKPLGVHFVSTMDGSQLSDLLHKLRPETTLFIISSKSFGTIDTLTNAETARRWLEKSLGAHASALKNHFIGVSSNAAAMSRWGIDPAHQLALWEWVGGRYSLWSTIGFPIALQIGVSGFKSLLAGAHLIDEHFKSAPFTENLPVLLGLIGVWNSNFLGMQTHAILPYDGRMKFFASYLQQLEMESNGKRITRDNDLVSASTCPIIWGEVGPNAQHAFYQLLHQGTHAVSADFIAPIARYNAAQFTYCDSAESLADQHHLALANCLAQSRLLAFGNDALGLKTEAELAALPLYKQYEGNQPSTTILVDELTPKTLGMLIALYEHKVFVQSVIWNINPFDQWGVEKGKEIASQLMPLLKGDIAGLSAMDSSTKGLIEALLKRE